MSSDGQSKIERLLGYTILYAKIGFFAAVWIALIVYGYRSCNTKRKQAKDHIYEKNGIDRKYNQEDADEVEINNYKE